jgi:hypothetical protein
LENLQNTTNFFKDPKTTDAQVRDILLDIRNAERDTPLGELNQYIPKHIPVSKANGAAAGREALLRAERKIAERGMGQ